MTASAGKQMPEPVQKFKMNTVQSINFRAYQYSFQFYRYLTPGDATLSGWK